MGGAPLEPALEDLLARWQHLAWWASLQPVGQYMLERGLTLPELIALRRIEHRPCSVADLAAGLVITPSAASRTVDRLVGSGLLTRHENPADRRQKLLALTPTGRALLGEVEAAAIDQLRPLLAGLDAGDRSALQRLLTTLLRRVDTVPLGPGPTPTGAGG